MNKNKLPRKMSHFSTIKTKIKEKDFLLEALNLLGHFPEEETELKVTGYHGKGHETVTADIAIAKDSGFKWNNTTGTFELVADVQTWDMNIPITRFLDKLTQQYARMIIHNEAKEQGFQVQEEWEMDDNSIELTVARWG